MSYVFSLLIGVSLIYCLFTGNASAAGEAFLSGSELMTKTVLGMAGSYAVYSGLIKIAEESGLMGRLSFLFSPFLKKLFSCNKKALGYISANLAANVLGMGSAATPLGVKAVSEMKNGDKPLRNISMFIMMNSASVQLFPMSMVALRSASGAASPADICPAVLAVSAASFVFAITLELITRRRHE